MRRAGHDRCVGGGQPPSIWAIRHCCHQPVATDRLPRNRRCSPRFLLPPPQTPPIPGHYEKLIGPVPPMPRVANRTLVGYANTIYLKLA